MLQARADVPRTRANDGDTSQYNDTLPALLAKRLVPSAIHRAAQDEETEETSPAKQGVEIHDAV